MEAVLGEPELFSGLQGVFFSSIADDAFSVQGKDQGIPGGCMLAESGARRQRP